MGGGIDEQRRKPGDIGIKSMDDDLGDGATGSRRGITHDPRQVSCPALLGLRIADPRNAFPRRALAEPGMA